VSTLEAKGHVKRIQGSGDRRQQLCSLTTRGRRVVDAAIPDVAAAQELLLSDLGRSEALQLTALLHRFPASATTPTRP
jgi:DNA-binding MarR family transcriptional regulator